MNIIVIALGILWCVFIGFMCYLLTISLIPDKFKDKVFSIIPFFPKTKYSIILYLLAGILYSLLVYELDITETMVRVPIAVLCVVVSSLLVQFIAKSRKENIEETLDEEIGRKRGF
ncbi:MAG: hypothetical protein P4L35_19860 [Ignavibacteriaceae bacterium]|nr:hypothetical protein [Ignavibacteriaceae bacterium]